MASLSQTSTCAIQLQGKPAVVAPDQRESEMLATLLNTGYLNIVCGFLAIHLKDCIILIQNKACFQKGINLVFPFFSCLLITPKFLFVFISILGNPAGCLKDDLKH